MSAPASLEALESRRLLATFTVTSAGNAGAGTLRQAILDANATPAADTIDFNIGGGGSVKTIALTVALPTLSTPITVDGRTQVGYTAATPKIRLQGPGAATAEGLRLNSDCAVYGLSIVNCDYAIVVFGSNVTLAANFLNLETDGVTPNGKNGIFVGGGNGNRIGTSALGGNAIAFAGTGVFIDGSTNFSMQSNLIGTTAAGNVSTGSSGNAVYITGTATGTIGEANNATARNTVSGVAGTGIWLNGGNVTVVNNTIGRDAARTAVLGNQNSGIYCSGGSHVIRDGNQIAYNGGNGVEVQGSSTVAQIYGNAMAFNGRLGIDLGNDGVTPNDPLDADTGPNGLQNYPVNLTPRILPNGSVRVRGTLNTTPSSFTYLDFYGTGAPDPSGFGEADVPFASTTGTTDGSGNLNFDVTIPAGLASTVFITATAEISARSSEFSRAIKSFRPGDLDGNGTINNNDIASFVQALTNPTAYTAAFPGIPIGPYGAGDINDDGSFNNNDIAPFVALLTAGRPVAFGATTKVSPAAAFSTRRVALDLGLDDGRSSGALAVVA